MRKPDAVASKDGNKERYRKIFYTYNNPTKTGPEWMEYVNERVPVAYHAVALEEGDVEHTPHFQGMIEFRQQVYKSQLAYLGKSFWFRRMVGTSLEAYEYVTKSGKWAHESHQTKDGPWFQGERSKPGYRTDIEHAVKVYMDDGPEAAYRQHTQTMVINGRGVERAAMYLFQPYVREVKLIILYGQCGTGKTSKARRTHGIKNVHRMPYGRNLQWLGFYKNQPNLLIDEFKGETSCSDPAHIHHILDEETVVHETKGGHAYGVWDTVYISTNKHPRNWYKWDKTETWEPFVRRITEFRVWHKDGRRLVREPDEVYKQGTEEFNAEFVL